MKRVFVTFILLNHFFFTFAGENTIFPNPTQNNFVIKSTTAIKLVEVYDFLGTKVKSFEYNQTLINSIDISELSTGRYFVKIYNESGKQEIIQLIKK